MMIASVRWATKASTPASSRAGLREVTESITCRCCAAAARCTPLAMAEKYGSAMSCTSSPSSPVADRASAWACAFGM